MRWLGMAARLGGPLRSEPVVGKEEVGVLIEF